MTNAHELAELQRLYDAEQNFSIECFWDAGFRWSLGDEGHGFTAQGSADTFSEAAAALVSAYDKTLTPTN